MKAWRFTAWPRRATIFRRRLAHPLWRCHTSMLPPLCNSVLDTIGGTPLVRLDRLCAALNLDDHATILGKLENKNPGHSKKDRIAYEIVTQAKRDGTLQPHQPVIELTSGNTGTGLAIVCQQLGHDFTAVMSEGNSTERAQLMRALGARVVLVPQAPRGSSNSNIYPPKNQVSGQDLQLVEETTQALTKELQAFRVDQFYRQANADAHYHGTAVEILEQLSGTSLVLDGFCDFVGTGGSFAGCAKRFNESLGPTNIACHVVEPAGIAPLAAKYGNKDNTNSSHPQHKGGKHHVIQGGGYNMEDLPLMAHVLTTPGYVNGFISVTNDQATTMARLLAMTEGIFGGFSAGANLHAAAKMIRQGQATTVVVLICDSGSKYYSANLLPPGE